ncbi:MAG: sigma-70 family RNA polymerase sigma factor [Myxococcaceae bacterium]
MPRTDLELLTSARKGDPAAIDELLAKHERQVYRFGLRMCGSEEDARDVLQETLIAAFKALPEFRGEAALSTWLYQIARSYCIKARRRGVGEPAETVPLDGPEVRAVSTDAAGPDARAHAKEIGGVLQAAIQVLPSIHREALVLRDVEGLSAEEAAKVLGIEVGALKSRLHRARSELREHVTSLLGSAHPLEGPSPCPELAQELSAYAGEELDQATCARIEEHLARCPRCTAACDTLKRTVSLCRQIPGDEVPAAVRRAVRQALFQFTGSSP